MAAPVVSGIASIMLTQKPDINVVELVSILNESSEDILEGRERIRSPATDCLMLKRHGSC